MPMNQANFTSHGLAGVLAGSLALLAVWPASMGLAAGATPARASSAQDDIETVLEEVDELMKRNPPRYHIRAYEALAATGDARAIEVLQKAYKKPGFPRKQTRHLIASAMGEKGTATGVTEELMDWLKESDDAGDAWLWRNLLALQIKEQGPDKALEIARTAKDIVQRAAAIEALAAVKDESLYKLIPELCKQLPKKDVEKMALMGAMATALAELGTKKSQVKGDWQQMALSLIATMEDDQMPRAAQLMLARHLAFELDAERMVLEPNAWRALIAAKSREAKEKKKRKKKKEKEGESEPEYAWPKFFGIDVTGDRVCYLIDLSDSMAATIPESWKPANGPTSGPSKRRKWKKGEVPTEADIPWYSVSTRFDLAREHLRISLMRMTPDQKFTIVGFGSRADYMDGCEGMVKASPSNIKKALKALDGIEIGTPTNERPDGTLWGDTNLFEGLQLAFGATKKGSVDDNAYVDFDALEHGADTILVLSDGNPSMDSFTIKDVDYGDGRVMEDSEAGKESDIRTMELNYLGPYTNWPFLLEETKRLNMLREAQIHVISVGDGDREALRRLAAIGLGKLTELGKK
ncbi:MAG: hypothetical protein ACJAQ3_001688 [Planctomycetota bacterium]|jgi:hypothetical protein